MSFLLHEGFTNEIYEQIAAYAQIVHYASIDALGRSR